ncbi:hypothetical protein PATSB16_15550 [Pandoraea thiooxydans]|nr:hypothetical protein PATSB16_15550 [Pandoraea thiooxydans]
MLQRGVLPHSLSFDGIKGNRNRHINSININNLLILSKDYPDNRRVLLTHAAP